MDVSAFVQENKRWLIGCGIGVVVFFIGSAIVGSVWNPGLARGKARALAGQAPAEGLHDQDALRAAQQEGERLKSERQRLQAELAFAPDPIYVLDGQAASPDVYLGKVGRELKQRVMQTANRLEVAVLDKDLAWPSPTGVEQIRGVLLGLALLDETARRLFAAHADVRAADPEAMGLRAILSLRLEERRDARQAGRVRPGEVDLRDLLTQERLMFQFQSDSATALRFFELCRQPGKCLVLEPFTMTPPTKPGDPVTVKGTLLGIAFVAKKEPS